MSDRPGTRADRRARTRTAILDAARHTFADHGFQKATIRRVAARAGCDPALVMQHFGTKEALFRAAIEIDVDIQQAYAGPVDTRTERLLRHIFERFDANPDSVASTLRSMFSHDESADEALRLFHPPPADGAEAAEPTSVLRQQLLMSVALGTAVARYVLKSHAVETASVDDLLAVLLPAARALEEPPAAQ